MKSVKFIRLLLASYLVGCLVALAQTNTSASNEWQIFHIRELLSFSAPPDFKLMSSEPPNLLHGDSFTMKYTNGSMFLGIDYGSSGLSGYEKESDVREVVAEIDGLKARVVTFSHHGTKSNKYLAAMYFPDGAGSKEHKQQPPVMWAICKNKGEQELAVKIFRSVKWLSQPA